MNISSIDRVPVQLVGVEPEGQFTYVPVGELIGVPPLRGTVPAAVAAYVQAYEGRDVTKLVLTNLPISVAAVTTSIGVGGVKIYDFPAGFIKRQGCRAVLSNSVATAYQADYTDNTPQGSLGIGTAVPADTDALGTDATDDDWGTATAYVMSAFADSSIIIPAEADGVHDGSVTPIDLYLNVDVIAADIDDGVTTQMLVSGTIWFNWVNQGGA